MARARKARFATDAFLDSTFSEMKERARKGRKTGIDWPMRRAVIELAKVASRKKQLRDRMEKARRDAREKRPGAVARFSQAKAAFDLENAASRRARVRLLRLIRRPLTANEVRRWTANTTKEWLDKKY